MNRDELLRVATALWAAGMRTGDDAIRDAEMLIKAVDAKCAKQHSSPIRVKPEPVARPDVRCPGCTWRFKPEPVAWRFEFPNGDRLITESEYSYDPEVYKTPLYEPEDA